MILNGSTLLLTFLSALLGQTRTGETPDRADQPILLKAGKVYVSPDEVIEDGAVVIRGGRIVSVGKGGQAPDSARVVDRPDGVITAGLIDANASVGFVDRFNATEHVSEVVPELRVLDMLDLGDEAFRRLADSGVTTVCVTADAGSVIGGRAAVVRTAGSAEDRVLVAAGSVRATIGREPMFRAARNSPPFSGRATFLTRRPTTRMGLVWVLRKSFEDALLLSRGEQPATRGEGSPSDAAIPYLQQVLRGDLPLRIQARTQADILTALRIAKEFNIPSFVLDEAHDANRCLDEIKAAGVAVVYGPIFDYPGGFRANTGEVERLRYNTPRLLLDAGIAMALSAADLEGEAALARQATYAMRHGLSRGEALAATTTTPAKILGLDNEVGRVAAGLQADVVVWSGEPFAADSRADVVVIGGRIVSGKE